MEFWYEPDRPPPRRKSRVRKFLAGVLAGFLILWWIT